MNIHKNKRPMLVAAVLTIVVLGAVIVWSKTPNTPGEKFRSAIQKIENACASRHLEPNEQCGEVAKLKPADPLATPEGRFARSIKLPEPLPKDSGYRKGMSPREYFDHLCETEAGEFIYRSVENVRGIFQLRPREIATDVELSHLYALEDPYGHVNTEARDTEFYYATLNRYEFFERAFATDRSPGRSKRFYDDSYFAEGSASDTVIRYSRYDGRNWKSMRKTYSTERKSHFGYTWRGIVRTNDREMGIAGGELIVLDLEANEVLGVRRGFLLMAPMRNRTGVWWSVGDVCPRYGLRGGLDKDFDFSYWFIGKVLKPSNYEESMRELTSGH